MKKLILLIAIAISTFSAFAQDSVYVNKKDGSIDAYKLGDVDSIYFEKSVLINGVRWAACNVASPGTFASSSEASGSLYQWNSKTVWAATGTVTGWDSSWNGGFTTPSASDTWAKANDPSPAGYRVPTKAELQTLLDVTKVTSTWTTQNGVNGRKFTDIASGKSIFLPAPGYRPDYNGTLDYATYNGVYWSNTVGASSIAYALLFFSSDDTVSSYYRASGLSVRPVAE